MKLSGLLCHLLRCGEMGKTRCEERENSILNMHLIEITTI